MNTCDDGDELTDDEWDDIIAALRIAAAAIEVTAMNLRAADDGLKAHHVRPTQVALRRQASRFRKLAQSLAKH